MAGGVFHGGAVALAATRFGGDPARWLDLSTGINPAVPALPEITPEIYNRLPDAPLSLAARSAARRFYTGTDQGPLPVAVAGTQSFIQLLPQLAPPGRPVAILSPTYGEYEHSFQRAGFSVDAIPSINQLGPRHGALIAVNPNNPDGRILSQETLVQLAERMETQGGILHVDEAFGDLDPQHSMVGKVSDHTNLTVSRSFGKLFGMAGLRLGFIFAAPVTLARLEAMLGPWPVSGPALHLSRHVLESGASEIVAAIAERRAALQAVLEDAGLETIGGTGLFALVRHRRAGDLYTHLVHAHILVRRFDYAADWLRIGLAPDAAGDQRLSDALRTADL